MRKASHPTAQAKRSAKAVRGRLFLDVNPSLLNEWDWSKNKGVDPHTLVAGSEKKYWWSCKKNPDHIWQASIRDRTKGSGCSYCRGFQACDSNSLLMRYPAVAQEWHPTKNGQIVPAQVVAGSCKTYWWKCSQGPDHEWQATPEKRGKMGRGCPFCAGKKASVTNSLATRYPSLCEEWHPSRNGEAIPEKVVAGSQKKYWWKCDKGDDHEWQASPSKRGDQGRGCPYCANLKISATNSLANRFPEVALQWHPTKNGKLKPIDIVAGTRRSVWWKCPKTADHEWQEQVVARTFGKLNCPFCSRKRVTAASSFRTEHPELLCEWHPTLNNSLTPDSIVGGSGKKVWWQCKTNAEHIWETSPSERINGSGCPYCANRRVSAQNSLTALFPEIAAEFHPFKNGAKRPEKIVAGSNTKLWWQCRRNPDHEWQTTANSRTSNKTGCPFCSGLRVSSENSLATTYPDIASEWHPTLNGDVIPHQIHKASNTKFWWICKANPQHVWQATPGKRTISGRGCPFCNSGWTVQHIKLFVGSLRQHINSFTSAELYSIFQQSGLLDSTGKAQPFIKAVITGRFPAEEIDKFLAGKPSLVDELVTKDQLETSESVFNDGSGSFSEQTSGVHQDGQDLPIVTTEDALKALDYAVTICADTEAVEFLSTSGTEKLWRHAFLDEQNAIVQARGFSGSEYAEEIKKRFLQEHQEACDFIIPEGYSFKIDGKVISPNLMQRLVAMRTARMGRSGNWSGTGAGKTLSAVLASRLIDAGLTVVCCPNSVVDGWARELINIFPDSDVETKTFEPKWEKSTGDKAHRYLVLNHEAFQQRGSEEQLNNFLQTELVDFVVVDEVHHTKQRFTENISQRKRLISALIAIAGEKNKELSVLGMSATPVINNLAEGKHMIEMITGIQHDDLDLHPTVNNCMKMHQRLVTLGIRWIPAYNIEIERLEPEIDCSPFLDQIHQLGDKGSPLALELILTQARLPEILKNVRKKTLIYTHYITDIDKILYDALKRGGWKVGFYTGDEKAGLSAFIDGDVDVLIGTSAISTGVDRLQHVCSNLIINVLPWTHAEYEQLLGRIYRQGQREKRIQVIIPKTFALVNGNRWSWCESKLERLKYKKSIADAAVDGIVPEGHLRSPAQAYKDVMEWLQRLETGNLLVVERSKILIPELSSEKSQASYIRRFGDFSTLNNRWNNSRSETTYQRLKDDPTEWEYYHALYREARKDWREVPFERFAEWLKARPDRVVGDFGCGEALLAQSVANTVHSFDHVAINDRVTACDMRNTGLENEGLDVAIFSLSLMGTNLEEYLLEAFRALKVDGMLKIAEPSSRWEGEKREELVQLIRRVGFKIVGEIEDRFKFVYIDAIKS